MRDVIQPWVGQPLHSERLAVLMSHISGRRLRAVHYAVPEGGTWPEGHRTEGAHEVDMAVELVLDNEDTLAFSWAMDGLNEGLAIELRPSGHSSEKPDAVVDVTDRREWSAYLGASVTAVVPVWHVPNEECPKMPWAFRLEFSPSKILVVALGESQGSGFTYMPDSLVVLFDEETAAAYHIPASSAPALGHR